MALVLLLFAAAKAAALRGATISYHPFRVGFFPPTSSLSQIGHRAKLIYSQMIDAGFIFFTYRFTESGKLFPY